MNVTRATLNALQNTSTPSEIAAKRGKTVEEIFGWLNLHTFGGVLIRPLGDKPDSKMDPTDLAIFKQVESWLTEHTGYAAVSGFHEFLYEPEKPVRGDLSDYAYHQRGALAYVVELWDVFKQLGIERKKPFVDHYSQLERKDFLAMAKMDAIPARDREFDLVDGDANTEAPGSHAVLVGNVIAKAKGCKGNHAVIHFGQDGGKDHRGTLYLVHNTIVQPFGSQKVAPGEMSWKA